MNEHVNAQIAAYHDGELTGAQRQKVAAHLKTCVSCQAELTALQGLSAVLQETPAPAARLSSERFVSQVRLRMGNGPTSTPWQRRLRTGWWLAPVGVIGLWAFGQAVLLVSAWLVTLLPVVSRPLALNNLVQAASWWQAGQGWALLILMELVLSLMTAALLGGWLASWWTMMRQRN